MNRDSKWCSVFCACVWTKILNDTKEKQIASNLCEVYAFYFFSVIAVVVVGCAIEQRQLFAAVSNKGNIALCQNEIKIRNVATAPKWIFIGYRKSNLFCRLCVSNTTLANCIRFPCIQFSVFKSNKNIWHPLFPRALQYQQQQQRPWWWWWRRAKNQHTHI